MAWHQDSFSLKPRPRGFHLVTSEIVGHVPCLRDFSVGMANVFIRHTSASLTINENADPDVRVDMESYMNKFVPENEPYFVHTLEGPDDMPAHIKASMMGASINIPIKAGRLDLGTWQGIYLCEHRNRGGARQITVTLTGEM